MVTSNFLNKHLLCHIVARQILRKVTKFGGSSLLTKKVKKVQSQCVQIPPSPGLNRVKKTSYTARKYVTQQPSEQSFKFYQFAREVFVLVNGLQQ